MITVVILVTLLFYIYIFQAPLFVGAVIIAMHLLMVKYESTHDMMRWIRSFNTNQTVGNG